VKYPISSVKSVVSLCEFRTSPSFSVWLFGFRFFCFASSALTLLKKKLKTQQELNEAQLQWSSLKRQYGTVISVDTVAKWLADDKHAATALEKKNKAAGRKTTVESASR
jgi:hypothetical protein